MYGDLVKPDHFIIKLNQLRFYGDLKLWCISTEEKN